MSIGKIGGVAVAAALNIVMFILSPILGAIGLPFTIGIAITLLKDMTKIAGALYLFMLAFLISGISIMAGLIALFFGGAAAIRLIIKR